MHLEGDDGDELEMDVELALTHELDYHLSPNGHPYYRAPGTVSVSLDKR